MKFRHAILKVSFSPSKPLSQRQLKYCFIAIFSAQGGACRARKAVFSFLDEEGNTVKHVGFGALQVGINPAVSCLNLKFPSC